jgi:hypothetical protein
MNLTVHLVTRACREIPNTPIVSASAFSVFMPSSSNNAKSRSSILFAYPTIHCSASLSWLLSKALTSG